MEGGLRGAGGGAVALRRATILSHTVVIVRSAAAPWAAAGKARKLAAVSHEQFVAIIYKINEMHFMATWMTTFPADPSPTQSSCRN